MIEDAAPSSTRRRALRAMLGALFAAALVTTVAAADRPPTRGSASPPDSKRPAWPRTASNCSRTAPSRPASSTRRTLAASHSSTPTRVPGRPRVRRQLQRLPRSTTSPIPPNPTIRTAVVCPGGQGESRSTGTCCSCRSRRPGRGSTAASPASRRRPAPFRGVRIFDISNLDDARPGRGGADVPRLSHAHAAEEPERHRQRLRLRVRHRGVRSSTAMASCVNDPRLGPEHRSF